MRFLIVQSGLRDRSDHFYNETLGWLRACKARDIPVQLLVHHAASKDVVAELGAHAVCPSRPFAKMPSDPVVCDLESFIKLSERLALALFENADDVGSDDIIVFPFATEREVYGTSQFLSRIAADQRPRVMFLFHHPDPAWTLKRSGELVDGDPSFCRYAAQEMARQLPPNRTWYCATNGALAMVMSGVMEVGFEKVPIPPYYGVSVEVEAGDRQRPAHIGILGNIRSEKGSDGLPAIINGFLSQRPGRSVFVQVGDATQKAALVENLNEAARPDVTVWDGVFSSTEFLARMKALDLLLLPYTWQRYVFRISSLFAEATACGVPTVVPARTWMARRIEEGTCAGAIFDTSSVATVVDRLVVASDRVAELKEIAATKRENWVRTQSTDALVGYLAARAQNS